MTLVHILRAETGEMNEKPFDVKKLPKLQRNYLKRWLCAGCGSKLINVDFCGTYGGCPPCSQASRNKRIKKALQDYKPRKRGQQTIKQK